MNPTAAKLEQTIGTVFLGKPRVVRLVLTAFFAQGHMLLEDVPGVGKTLLARTLARAVRTSFRRIQFTPDLLPSDLLGTSVFNQKTGDFEFRQGPIFASVILADEINRTTPRTQSALLEAMNAASISLDGVTHTLPRPFVVLATQNPFEFEGTYALPESQLDRFLMRIDIGYPTPESEKRMLIEQQEKEPLEGLEPVLSTEDVMQLQAERSDEGARETQVVSYHGSLNPAQMTRNRARSAASGSHSWIAREQQVSAKSSARGREFGFSIPASVARL